MVVADSCVWIDFFAGRETPEVGVLDRLLERVHRVGTCGPVLMEVLQGPSSDREAKAIRLRLSKFPYLDATRWTFMRAASLFRVLRKKGVRLPPLDVLIGTVCLEHDVPLLTSNRRDFEPLARHAGLRLA